MPEDDDRNKYYYGDRPPPTVDPTTITTEAIERSEKQVRELHRTQREADHNLFQSELRVVADKVLHLKELHKTQIDDLRDLVTQTFDAFKTLVEETNKLNDKALKAAFDASSQVVVTQQQFNDKATTKAETSLTTQIGEVIKRMDLNVNGLTDKIEEDRKSIEVLGTRVTTVEGRRTGETENKVDTRASITAIAGWIFGSIMAMGIILTLVFHH